MALNTTKRSAVQVANKDLPHTDKFTYLGSIISRDGGADLAIQSRLNKVKNSLNMMIHLQYSYRTKLKVYHSCVLTTLLFGLECWRLTEKDLTKLFTFHTKSFHRILHIFWPKTISNTCSNGVEPNPWLPWRWIGHVTRQETCITRTALYWTPERKRRRGRPHINYVAADGGEGNKTDGKDLEQFSSHDEGQAEVEGLGCCPTRHPA